MLIVPQTPVGWVQRSVTHRFARPTPRRRLRRRTFNLAPKRAVIWSSIGYLLVRMGRESLPKDANGQTDFSPFAPEHDSWKLFDAAVRAHRVANKLEPGVAMFEKALALALNTVGVALRTKKQFRAALSNCREAVRLAPAPNAPIIDLAPAMADFADTAAIVSELDLIIMTDSAVAHLAGAMGKPVWLLLNYGPYWMWSVDSPKSSWYGSLSQLKNKSWQSWAELFDAVASQLIFRFLSTNIARRPVGEN